MIEIRTPKKKKLFGMLNTQTYTLHIKDGKDERIIQVPVEGMTLIYITDKHLTEEIIIPPKATVEVA